MRPEAHDILIDRKEEWLLTVDDFYEKVKGGHWVNIKVEDGGSRDRRKSHNRERCDCCGNRMLKTLFPILCSSGNVYWVGCECMEQLLKRGLHSSGDTIEVKEERNGRKTETKGT